MPKQVSIRFAGMTKKTVDAHGRARYYLANVSTIGMFCYCNSINHCQAKTNNSAQTSDKPKALWFPHGVIP